MYITLYICDMNTATRQRYQRSFAELGNPLKFKIFLKIAKEGCDCDLDHQAGYEGNCVSAIVKDLKIPQSTASTYIKDLKKSGLIVCKKNGKYLYCQPNLDTFKNIKSLVDGIIIQMEAKWTRLPFKN